jgi:hypothetical protein
MRSSFEISPSSSSYSSSCEENEELTPTQLLSVAIKKRRALYEGKDRDYRKELLHTGMIQSLCKFLGEGRALRRRSKRKRRSSNSQKRTELPQKYALSNEQLENMGQPVEKPEPTMLELNGGYDDDAVVPVLKRAKYEQIFEPAEPTEQEKEIIKEYVFEDFFSSLASFYTPEYYTYSNVEPTKDLYWCSLDTDTELLEVPSMPPDFELLALCS